MNEVRQFTGKQGIFAPISFKETPRHIVKILGVKETTVTDNEGNEKPAMKFLVEENGEKKKITTSATSFLLQIQEYEVGDTLIIEMKRKSVNGQPRTYFEIEKTSEAVSDVPEDDSFPPVEG